MSFHYLGSTEFAELFKSTTIRVFIDWTYGIFRNTYLMGVLFDIVVAVAFTIFAILYSHKDDANDDDAPVSNGTMIALIAVPCLGNLMGIFCSFSLLRYGSLVSVPHSSVSLMSVHRIIMLILDAVLFVHACCIQHCTTFSAFTTSIGCILCWVVVRFFKVLFLLSVLMRCLWIQFFRTLRPVGRLGPFVSMVGYAVNDSLPFAMMGLILMLGYSAAFMVLFDGGFGDGDGDYFNTFPHALETLFHTGLGNFETEVGLA